VPGVPGSDNARLASPLQVEQGELARLQLERRKLLNNYKPTYPGVRAIDQQILAAQTAIASLQKSAKPATDDSHETATAAQVKAEPVEDDGSTAQLRSQLESNRVEIENLTKDEAQQKAVISQYQSRLNLTPVREQQLASILRDYDLSKKDYEDLLGKEQQSQLAMSLEKQQGGQQFRLVEPPSLPDIPSSPKRVKLSLGGVGAGLFLGLVAAFLKELARPTFHTTKEISLKFGAPLVIGLPVILTRGEGRRRAWKRTFEWLSGSVVAIAICAAEFYVLRHP
jgi:uncharacterized protein involved in exopolysaccharide biosynthesis